MPVARQCDPAGLRWSAWDMSASLAVAFGRQWPTLLASIRPVASPSCAAARTTHTGNGSRRAGQCAPVAVAGSDPALLDACNVYIVTVPTPIDAYEQPDLEPLRSATRLIASHLRAGDPGSMSPRSTPEPPQEVCVRWNKGPACASTKTSTAATAPNGSAPVTAGGACRHPQDHLRIDPRRSLG